ncbi:hypothetical protein CFOL_v3_18125 [Cephalotus follicularis]|uniref:Uncharacterized protein n=1 Tax=Cephalotus follicularis TaxID=3775 RepID=A0A1Q3C337_CEPFO|nr:hypothetical protein CFOL_v3_18125 [Cephalotus follicularis]
MEQNPHRVSRRDGAHVTTRNGPTRKTSRYTVDQDSGDLIDCSGRYCKSCTAGLVADCVALCCCPCAVLNILAFAFVKVPYMVGRRCLGLGNKKGKRLEMQRKCRKSSRSCNEGGEFVLERDGNLRKGRVNEGMSNIESGFNEEEQMGSISARCEAERVWLELYQVGHLGFGRVSFTGIQG